MRYEDREFLGSLKETLILFVKKINYQNFPSNKCGNVRLS